MSERKDINEFYKGLDEEEKETVKKFFEEIVNDHDKSRPLTAKLHQKDNKDDK